MAYADAESVVVSPAWIWRAPVGTAAPDPNDTAVGDDTVWTGWTPLGYTLTPLTFGRTIDQFGVDVQQSTTDVKTSLTGEEVTLSSEMAEISPTNLSLVLQGTNTVTAAGAAQVGNTKVEFGGNSTLTQYKWGVEWKTELDDQTVLASRLIIYKGTIAMDGDLTFGEGEAAALPFTITAVADSALAAGLNIGYFEIATEDVTA